MKRFILFVIILFIFLICSSFFANADESSITDNYNSFALDFYHELAKDDGDFFCSPYGSALSLATIYAGSKGKTAYQLEKLVKGFVGKEDQNLLADVNHRISNSPFMVMSNAIWIQREYPIVEDYREKIVTDYRLSINLIDFTDTQNTASQLINGWVKGQTRSKIDKISFSPINHLARIVLTDTVYFETAWEKSFNKKNTQPMLFWSSAFRSKQVSMMFQSNFLKYYEDEQLKIIEVPFVEKNIVMMFVLPRMVDGLADIEKMFSVAQVKKWQQVLKIQAVDVYIPIFREDFRVNHKERLKKKELIDMFSPGDADLSVITGYKALFVQELLNRSMIEVSEGGTKSIETIGDKVNLIEKKEFNAKQIKNIFKADRPFIYLIKDRETGAILFMGRKSSFE